MLRAEPVTTDLITLADDVATLVDAVDVPSGVYAKLRFVVDGAYLAIHETCGPQAYATLDYAEAPAQVDGDLMCPSCGETGFKVSFPGSIALEGNAGTLTVDFDVSESFGQLAGQAGLWVTQPLLTALPPAS